MAWKNRNVFQKRRGRGRGSANTGLDTLTGIHVGEKTGGEGKGGEKWEKEVWLASFRGQLALASACASWPGNEAKGWAECRVCGPWAYSDFLPRGRACFWRLSVCALQLR